MSGAPCALAAAALASITLLAASASAEGSRWARARDPELHREHVAGHAAETKLFRQYLVRRGKEVVPAELSDMHALGARQILREAGAEQSRSPRLRLLLGQASLELHDWPAAARALESVALDATLHPAILTDAADALAITYARLGRKDEEIATYELAISLEPLLRSRSTLLANQSEAFMVLGDVSRAVAGYRAALELLTNAEMFEVGTTTLWSLGVALDRSGDLAGALQSVARARSYDPTDKKLGSESWFYVPAYDEAYYKALGHLLVARRASDVDEGLAAYERSILAWRSFLVRAPESDVYRPVARARLQLVEREAEAFGKRARTATLTSDPAGRGQD